MRTLIALTIVGVAIALIACGSSSDQANAPPESATPPAPTPTTTAGAAAHSPASACRQPSGQEKAALRFAVRAHDRELKDEPWALVRRRGINYMAAQIDATGPRLIVLVRFDEDGQYLAGMKALNGTARTFTDLPAGSDTIPRAGDQALDCIVQ
jgi:hypothetical protein